MKKIVPGTAVVLVALAGCSAGPTPAAPAPASPAASPTRAARDALLDAVPSGTDTAYRFTTKGNETPLTGVVDAPRKRMRVTAVTRDAEIGLTMTMTWLIVDDDRWVRISFAPAGLPGLPKLPKKWLKLDPARLDDPGDALEFADPGYAGLLLTHAGAVTPSGAGTFRGTTDLVKAKEAEIVAPAALKKLGDRAKKVPFTAEIDAGGHLTRLRVAVPGRAYAVDYSGFGATESPAAPAAGDQTRAPAVVYEMVNG